jgi:glycosyltransferase involved in cell wall biosynthesis
MSILVSIVSGTYNRLPMLMRMVESCRKNIPSTIKIEFVLVDGGSKDGTQKWCKSQPDVTLIEHRKLLGAIKAFCDGAKAASGQYVCLVNDDITMVDDSILRALVHLESHPTCGAVAFEDNRVAPGYGEGFHVQTISAVNSYGAKVDIVYAQVGMYRRWLGDACGWWGADDPIMGSGHTYGADCWLSARIWERGYTVDHVAGVRVVDHVAQDTLRETNSTAEQKNPGMYYKAYPVGPKLPARLAAPQDTEALRVLYLPIYEPMQELHRVTKRGLREAMQRRGFIVAELDYVNERVDIPAMVDAFHPHIMLTQIHDARNLPAYVLAECRKRKPDMLIINWNGDARGLDESSYLALLKHVDMQLVVNAAVLPVYQDKGIRAAFWQIGYEEPHVELPDVPNHDVVILGTCYNQARRQLEQVLLELAKEGVNVGFYGMGWQKPNGHCLYDFATGEALYRNAKIAISDTFTDGYTKVAGFVSNRVVQAMHAGVLVFQQECPGLFQWTGLRDGAHYLQWRNAKDLQKQLRHWVQVDDAQRRQIADAAKAYVDERYNFDALLDELFEVILPQLEGVTA